MERMNAIAKTILAEAKKLGADYAQCTVSESEKKEFNVDGGQFSLMRTLFNRNIVITVLKEQRKGTVQINRFEEDSVKAAVADAVAASDSATSVRATPYRRLPSEARRTTEPRPRRAITPATCVSSLGSAADMA